MNGRFRNAARTVGLRARNVVREARTNRNDGVSGRVRRAFAAARGNSSVYPNS